MSSVAGKDKPMDVVEDELELDVKDELQPILASAAEINTEFKDEFSDETEIDPLVQDKAGSDKASTDDQDTEGDSVNDAEEVEEDLQETQDEDVVSMDEAEAEEAMAEDEDVEQEPVVETEILSAELDSEDADPLTDPLMAGEDPLHDGLEENGTESCLDGDGDAVDGDLAEAGEVVGEETLDGTENTQMEGEDGVVDEGDPLAEDSANTPAGHKTGTKRKSSDTDKPEGEVTVRKSSRIKQLVEIKKAEKEDSLLQGKSVHDAQKEKQKMLQKPTERPTRLDTDDENTDAEKISDTEAPGEGEEEAQATEDKKAGDRSRPPGADALRKIDQDFLLPFRYGWTREVVIRPVKTGPPQIDIFYWPPKDGEDHGPRKREALRKRRSKVDQERYFEEFKSTKLSVNNFSYVRRPLDLNNEAYEIIRRNSKPSLETRSDRTRAGKVASYKEVAEHEGLLSGSSSEEEGGADGDGDDIEDITEFDQGLPLSLQVLRKITPLREESKKRRKFPNRDRCITPPLAEDIPWTLLDDDPLGIYSELGGRSSPATPPPLRAMRLTSHTTVNNINNKINNIKSGLVDPLIRITESNKDLDLKENLASHDSAIKKFKNFRPNPPPQQRLPGRPQQQRQGLVHPKPHANRPSLPPPRPPNTSSPGYVKVRLPMLSSNGKRPVVELVMLTNGKYQPIKFTNNRQVTESIPKRLFDQASNMRKTLYQRSVQVPKIGTKQVFIAINPSPGGAKTFNGNLPQQQQQQRQQPQQQKQQGRSPAVSEQVSILVRPAQGGNAVLLNVPRHVALKVKIGTTLSFSASNEQKYTVIDNKMHPPVGKGGGSRQQAPPPPPQRPVLPNLPAGVSIRPINRRPVARPPFGRQVPPPLQQAPAASFKQHLPTKPRQPPPGIVRKSSGGGGGGLMSSFTPCSPFCPGVTGIPELECCSCHSLFHPVCVGIPQSRIHQIQGAFRCKACSSRPIVGSSSAPIQVIDLD